MTYQPFALKYRPQRFRDLVGQEPVAQTLRNALRDDRVANAFLFTGSRGVGKTSSARILAKALNCPQPIEGEPCCVCDICRAVAVGEDLDVLEIDGASNRGIDEIRRIRDNVSFLPARSRYKIYIIDEVHMLTAQAFNALLKTLEEPPAHVKCIFATTEYAQVPETIVSRCQRFDFRRITIDDLVGRLAFVAKEEGLDVGPGVFEEIARKAEGGLRDTMSLLDQVVSFSGPKIELSDLDSALGGVDVERIRRLLVAAGDGDAAGVLRALDDCYDSGRDAEELTEQALEALRETMVVVARELPAGAGGRRAPLIADLRARFDLDRLLFAVRLLLNTAREIKAAGRGRMQLEVALLKLARSVDLTPWREILDRLERGESAGGFGAARRTSSGPPVQNAGPSGPPAPSFRPAPPAAVPISAPKPTSAPTSPASGGAVGGGRPMWSPPSQRAPETGTNPPRTAPSEPAPARPSVPSDTPPTRSAGGSVAGAASPKGGATSTPAPRAAPAAAPSRPASESTRSDAESDWAKVFRVLQTVNPRVAAAVDGGAVLGVEGAEIRIELPAGRTFQKRTLETAETRAVVEKLLREASGFPWRVRYELGAAGAGPSDRAPKRDIYSDPGVRKVLDAFDGGVIHVQGDQST